MKIDYNHKLISHLYTILFLLILPALFLSGTIFAANTNISITIVTGNITTGGNQNQGDQHQGGGSYYSKNTDPDSDTQTGPTIVITTGTTLGDEGRSVVEDWIDQIDGTNTIDEQPGHTVAEIIYTTLIGGGPKKILNLIENNVYIDIPVEKNQTEFEIGASIQENVAPYIDVDTATEAKDSYQQFAFTKVLMFLETVFEEAKEVAISYTYSLTRLAFDLVKGDSSRIASIIFSQVMAY